MVLTNWIYVTGCDSGFGSLVVRDLSAKGFGVFAAHLLADSAEKLKAAHANIVPVQVDITKQEEVDAAGVKIRAHLEQVGNGAQLTGLLNNAGLMLRAGPIEWTPAKNMDTMMQINVIGAHRVTLSVLPLLRKSRGRIVNVASMAGIVSLPTQTAYSASKFAMEGYTDGLRREVFDWGVTVHIIEPGVFKLTGLYSTYRDGVQKLWDDCSDEVKLDYGEDYKDGVAKRCDMALGFGNTNTAAVPKAMVHALTSACPKYRYKVGIDCNYVAMLGRWLHESWLDALFRIDPMGRLLAAKMSPDARSTSLARYPNSGWTRTAFWLFVMYVLLKIRKGLN